MRFTRTSWIARAARRQAGFTLAEVLAALVFMAIVIPVAVQGLRIANLAGVVAQRKSTAALVADQVLNEVVVTGGWSEATQTGTIQQGPSEYRWQVRTEPWNQDSMRVVSVRVTFLAQGQEYDVQLSTLVDSTTTEQ